MSVDQTTQEVPEVFMQAAMAELQHYGIPPKTVWYLEKAYGIWIGGLEGVDVQKLRRNPNISYEMALKIKRALNALFADVVAGIPLPPIKDPGMRFNER